MILEIIVILDMCVPNRKDRHTTRMLLEHFEDYILRRVEERGPPAPLFITIFLGANDACLPPVWVHVPLPEYEKHIRHYVNSILEHPATKGTKVILITPPPIDVSAEKLPPEVDIPSVVDVSRTVAQNGIGHMTWASKRRYAEKIVEIGRDFQEKTDLVAVLDFWTAITKFACQADGDPEEVYRVLDVEDLLPGCGLPGAKEFGEDIFTDGLHLGKTVCPLNGVVKKL